MTLALNYSSANMDNKYQPAYEGAKFDKSGYCLKHPMIRLCKPSTSGESSRRLMPSDTEEAERAKPQIKYVIVRKTCPMCGEHSLRNERKLNKVHRSHGYQQPTLPERHSCKSYVSAHSERRVENFRSSTSSASTAVDSLPSSPEVNKFISRSNSFHSAPISSASSGKREKHLEDRFSAIREKLPRPPIRESFTMRELDASLDSCSRTRDVSPLTRLAGKVPCEDPSASTRREKNAPRSTSRRESLRDSSSGLLDRSVDRRSRGRSITCKTKSSRRGDRSVSVTSTLEKSSNSVKHRSSSRHQRPYEEKFSNSTSVGSHIMNTSLSRMHSTEALSTKSLCNLSSVRRDPAKRSLSNLEVIDLDMDAIKRDLSSCLTSTVKRKDSKGTAKSISAVASSVTSSQKNIDARVRRESIAGSSHLRGRSKSKSKNGSYQMDRKEDSMSSISRGKSKSKLKSNDHLSEEVSIFSRGRSKSKARHNMQASEEAEENSFFSARRSFANSLTRRRSLSRNASRVLKTTSTMDGSKDAEPCIQLYEVPFNPTTGRCHYHPEISLAARDGGRKGGWRMVRDCCPKCIGLGGL